MAARKLRILHSDDVRAKIQTSQLINRLTDHALGKIDLSTTQVRSIEVLIRKTLPDLQAVTHEGEIDHNLKVTKIERVIVRPDDRS